MYKSDHKLEQRWVRTPRTHPLDTRLLIRSVFFDDTLTSLGSKLHACCCWEFSSENTANIVDSHAQVYYIDCVRSIGHLWSRRRPSSSTWVALYRWRLLFASRYRPITTSTTHNVRTTTPLHRGSKSTPASFCRDFIKWQSLIHRKW